MNDAYVIFEELMDKARNGAYYYKDPEPTMHYVGENHIFDEDLSVKKNREMAIAHNEKVKEQKRQRLLNRDKVRQQFHNDCVSCLMGSYGWNFKQEIAEHIVKTLEEKDYDNDVEFVYALDRVADFVAEIINMAS